MAVSLNLPAKKPPNDADARTDQEKNRQNDKDYQEFSLKQTLTKYGLTRFADKFKKKGIINLDGVIAMDEESIHTFEKEIIGAAKLKHRNFEKFIRGETMAKHYQSEYLKNKMSTTNVSTGNGNTTNSNTSNSNSNSNYTQQQHSQNQNSNYGVQNYEQYREYGQYPQQAQQPEISSSYANSEDRALWQEYKSEATSLTSYSTVLPTHPYGNNNNNNNR